MIFFSVWIFVLHVVYEIAIFWIMVPQDFHIIYCEIFLFSKMPLDEQVIN